MLVLEFFMMHALPEMEAKKTCVRVITNKQFFRKDILPGLVEARQSLWLFPLVTTTEGSLQSYSALIKSSFITTSISVPGVPNRDHG